MQKVFLYSALVSSVLSLTAAAQVTTDPCGPNLIPVSWVDSNAIPQTSPAQISGLGISLGSDVGAIDVIPQYDAAGNNVGPYIIAAAVKYLGSGGWDCVTATWVGPGNNCVLDGTNGTAFCAALNGPGDEFQFGLDRTALIGVTDTGPGHPVGGGNAILATRAANNVPFAAVVAIVGVDPSYIDPCLGKINKQDILFWVDGPGNIQVGDIDVNPASATYGNVTNVRMAIDLTAGPAGIQFWHSPEPVVDEARLNPTAGETRAVISSVFAGSGSDAMFQSTPDQSQFTNAPIKPQLIFDDAFDWDANPANFHGTAFYADAVGGAYGVPLRLDYASINSAAVPATGGSAAFTIHGPGFNYPPAPAALLVAFNIGIPAAAPVTLPGVNGAICVVPLVPLSGPMVQSQFSIAFTTGTLPSGLVLAVEGAVLDTGSGQLTTTNMGFFEVQ